MKKLFLILALLPLFSFADLTFTLPRGFYYSPSGSFSTNVRNGNQSPFTADQAVYALGQISYKGIPVSFNKKTGWTTQLLHPDFSISPTNRNSSATYNYPFYGSDGKAYPYSYFNLYPLYSFIRSLYLYGYKSQYFELVLSNDVADYYNVKPLNLMIEIINGTNSVYKQEVINTLKLLNTNISSISSNIDSFISDFRSLNSFSLGDYSTLSNDVKKLALNGTISYSDESTILDMLNMSGWDLSDPEGIPSYTAYRDHVVSSLNAAKNLQALLNAIDPNYTPGRPSNLNDVMKQLGDAFNKSLQSSGSSNSSNIISSIALSTNWVKDVKRELEENTEIIKKQLGIFQVVTNADGTVAVAGKNGGLVGVRIENQEPITFNLDGPIDLAQTTINKLGESNANIIEELKRHYTFWDDWRWRENSEYSWKGFIDFIKPFYNTAPADLSSIRNSTSNTVDLLENINSDLVDGFRGLGTITNQLADIYDLLEDLDLNFSNADVNVKLDSLLLSDYDDFITNNHYSAFLDSVQNLFTDIPPEWTYIDFIDNFDVFDDSSGSGRWWRFISANQSIIGHAAVSNLSMMAYIYSNLVATAEYADNQFDGGFLGQAKKVISSIPSIDEAQYQISQVTQAIYSAASGYDEVYNLLGSKTNEFGVTISSLYKNSNLPDSISLPIIPDHPFTIPVGQQQTLWDLIRLGIAFCISIVNLVLLPKFILKLFVLFFGTFDKEIHIANMDQSH